MPDADPWKFRDSPAALVIPTGSPDYEPDEFGGDQNLAASVRIDYWPLPDTYSERFTTGEGCTATIDIAVDAGPVQIGSTGTYRQTSALFAMYALGFTRIFRTGVGPVYDYVLKRKLPLQLPTNRLLYLTDLVVSGRSGCVPYPETDDRAGWPDFGWLTYKATFSDPGYDVFSDDAVPNTLDSNPQPDELARYVSRKQKPAFREKQIPSYQLETDDGVPVSEPGWVIDRVVDYVYTWHQVPLAAYPADRLAALAGCVNSLTFDPTDMRGEPGTVLFRGVSQDIEDYTGRDGGKYVDIALMFSRRATGWNKYLRPAADPTDPAAPVGWRYKGTSGATTRRPFPAADLNLLFRPA